MAKRRRYSEEYKRDAVKLAQELGSAPKAAKQLGINLQSLYNWEKKFAQEECAGDVQASASLLAENRALRKKLKEAEMERDLLKKTILGLAQPAEPETHFEYRIRRPPESRGRLLSGA